MALCCMTPAVALDVSAHSAILMDGTTGRVLYEKNADERSLIASTTKIMTALIALEQAELDAVVKVPAEAVGIEGSSMYLKKGECLTVEELLYGLMLSSGNDAAVAIALHVSDSIEEFVEEMNNKAEELELTETHFANPNGLDSEENYGTARELAAIAAYALKNPTFVKIASTKSVQCTDRRLVNHNKLLWQYEGAVGVKTGYTRKAGRILVGAAQRNGRTLISVTINAPEDWQDHRAMLDYGFAQYEERELISCDQALGHVAVISGTEENAALCAGASLRYWLLPEETPTIRLHVPQFLYAPVEQGEIVGCAELCLGETVLAQLPVKTEKKVEQIPAEKGPLEKLLERMGICSAGIQE